MRRLLCIFSMLITVLYSEAQNVGIGTTTPTNKLSVAGKADISDSLGVGISTPEARLDVIGNIKITDGTQAAGKVLTSDANGKATWEAQGGNVQFKANTNAQQATPNGTTTMINFPDEEYDDSNNFDPVTGIFTAPSAGLYHFDVNLVFDGGAVVAQTYVRIIVNGAVKSGNQAVINAGILSPINVSSNVKLAAGDQVQVRCDSFGDNASIYSSTPMNNFSGYKVR